MTTAIITSKGRITIPKKVRVRLRLGAGDRIQFVECDGGVYKMIAITKDIRDLKGIIPRPGSAVTLEEMNLAVRRALR